MSTCPLAFDDGGNLYVMKLSESNACVYLYMQEEQKFYDTSWPSFECFLESFYQYEKLISLNELEKEALKEKIKLLQLT